MLLALANALNLLPLLLYCVFDDRNIELISNGLLHALHKNSIPFTLQDANCAQALRQVVAAEPEQNARTRSSRHCGALSRVAGYEQEAALMPEPLSTGTIPMHIQASDHG